MHKKNWLVTGVFLLSLVMGVWYYKSHRIAQLKRLLAAGQWQKADEKTSEIMLRETNRDILGKLDFIGGHNSMATFRCQKLREIDELWLKYSQGRFGFSVQQSIWQSIFEKRQMADFEEYSEFAIEVGWQKNKSAKNFQRTFTLEAPQGHLPSFDWMMKTSPSGSIWMHDGVTIFSRVKNCKINTSKFD